MLRIKDEPELQHVLIHMRIAIDNLASGHGEAAMMEMQAIESMIDYTSVEEQEAHYGMSQEADQGVSEEDEKGAVVRQEEPPQVEAIDEAEN